MLEPSRQLADYRFCIGQGRRAGIIAFEVGNVLAFNAIGGGDKAHSLSIAAVEREGHADLLSVIAGELKAIGAPAQVGPVSRHPTIMTALNNAAGVPL